MDKALYYKANALHNSIDLCEKIIYSLDEDNFATIISFDLKAKNPTLYDEYIALCKNFFKDKISKFETEFFNL